MHSQRHLGPGDKEVGSRKLFVRSEATASLPQQFTGTRVLAKLRHGDIAQGRRRCIIVHGEAMQGARESARAGAAAASGVHGDTPFRRTISE